MLSAPVQEGCGETGEGPAAEATKMVRGPEQSTCGGSQAWAVGWKGGTYQEPVTAWKAAVDMREPNSCSEGQQPQTAA